MCTKKNVLCHDHVNVIFFNHCLRKKNYYYFSSRQCNTFVIVLSIF